MFTLSDVLFLCNLCFSEMLCALVKDYKSVYCRLYV